ncbi:diacylglycerol lipase-beta-like [Schistocerca cancellata]|uniref:diacylglycerol lipase-beta-like n=1 Tax=Schistocerca cancellata TaxID=274614 RepID=UPI002118C126|nr:diacylglycerol lipase-beta-like [Schistocerca cancellata]XP_049776824.1 diacylglycerol lipase-beta-like [Schistocerca cancellata]XP_049776825.1 diacylglycerol lipase-beta-like [Schistocerca cancellata]
MPSLKLFGRKWLVATDDLVFPGLFEFAFRTVWLVLVGLVAARVFPATWRCERGGRLARAYLAGVAALLALLLPLLAAIVNRSAQGAVMDTEARRLVPALLAAKVLLIIPEVGWNIMGTIWAFSDLVECESDENFTRTVIEALVLFNWVLFALSIFGLALVFDPLGSTRLQDDGVLHHRKVTNLWVRRFQWVFCWVRKDRNCHEAFQHIASLFSALLRNTDLVPSDFMAALVLLRVMQKRETRELRRAQLLSEQQVKYIMDAKDIMADCPSWMSLESAHHFLQLAIASYGWPFVMYRYPVTGICRLTPKMTCCACFRQKAVTIREDNCCLCHFAGVRYMSELDTEDILFASFENELFQLPFFVTSDHKTCSIVIVIRGSISMRDVFTDLTAGADYLEIPELPENSMGHRGMILGAKNLKKVLQDTGVIDKAIELYPHYSLTLTGHSLGAGVAVLLGLMLRSKYPNLKVYAISPPAGVLSREAAKVTEEFTFSIGVGDDFVMRLGVDSMENIRTNALRVLKFCKLPKYRILLNGFGYALFGIPARDLETTWKSDAPAPNTTGHLPLLLNTSETLPPSESAVFERDFTVRRFSRTQLYMPGRILHITHRKKTKTERKNGTGGPDYEMRWAIAEEFTEFRIMPRMLLDHLPENVYDILGKIIRDQQNVMPQKPYVSIL